MGYPQLVYRIDTPVRLLDLMEKTSACQILDGITDHLIGILRQPVRLRQLIDSRVVIVFIVEHSIENISLLLFLKPEKSGTSNALASGNALGIERPP